MSRFSSNCRVTRVLPSDDDDVISFTPAMRPSARSSGVATVAAITSGLAPGNDAVTDTTGKSTWGSGETGSSPNDTIPASATPTVSSVVATGRFTKGWVMFTTSGPRSEIRGSRRFFWLRLPSYRGPRTSLLHSSRGAIEIKVDHRRGEDREQLREDEAEVRSRDEQRQQRAHARRRQRREDGHGMDVALVEHAQHDVHRDDGGEDEEQRIEQRRAVGERRSLEVHAHRRGQVHFLLRLL